MNLTQVIYIGVLVKQNLACSNYFGNCEAEAEVGSNLLELSSAFFISSFYNFSSFPTPLISYL